MATYTAKYENLPVIAAQIVQAAQEAGLPESSIYDVELAVDEACTNIIEHAYAGTQNGLIECTTLVTPDGLRIYLRDTGCHFDPNAIPAPKLNIPPSKRKERGLGLFFIRKLMDEVHFDACSETGTILTLFKSK